MYQIRNMTPNLDDLTFLKEGNHRDAALLKPSKKYACAFTKLLSYNETDTPYPPPF